MDEDRTARARSLYEEHGDKLRFLVVGGWNSLFAYGMFAALLYLLGPLLAPLGNADNAALQWIGEHHYLVVQVVAWFLSVPQSTIAFKLLVFKSSGHWAAEIARSYLVYAPLQVLSLGILWLATGVIGMHPLLGQLIAMAVNAVLSYVGNKRFTFRL